MNENIGELRLVPRSQKPFPGMLVNPKDPEIFMLIFLLEVCQEGGIKKGGTWRTLRVGDHIFGGQNHS